MRKINEKYYLLNITWPRGGMRTQLESGRVKPLGRQLYIALYSPR